MRSPNSHQLRIPCHGRYVLFQLAEVAVALALFAAVLRRIELLRWRACQRLYARENGTAAEAEGERCAKDDEQHRNSPNPPATRDQVALSI
jgi:hypothetical protein